GTGQVRIEVGKGAEGFLNDARAGRISDAMIPALRNEDYSSALETGAGLLAQAFADEFHVTLSAPAPAPQAAEPQTGPSLPGPIVAFVVFLIIILVLSSIARAGRGGGLGALWWLSILGSMRGSGRGRWGGGGGGGWGGFGGGGGGGFGGFGGGGGFSGGGAGGRF
ncbi:MAG TPA: TPM domain-containing protein, partial [Gemmatimonadales bacterium]|nr:TPM domain-containing protein [Gemmatimonadales bacterium]